MSEMAAGKRRHPLRGHGQENAAVWYFSRYRISKLSLIERLAVMSEHEPQRLSPRHRELLEGAWDAKRE